MSALHFVTQYDPVSDQYEDQLVGSGGFAKICPKVSYDQVHNEVVVLIQAELPESTPHQLARFTPELMLLSSLNFPMGNLFFPDFAVSDRWATIITHHPWENEPPNPPIPEYFRMITVYTASLYEDDNIEMPATTSISVHPGNQYAFFSVGPGNGGFAGQNYVIWR